MFDKLLKKTGLFVEEEKKSEVKPPQVFPITTNVTPVNQELPLEQTKVRTNWISEGSEIFTQNRNYINSFIPKNN